MWFFIIGTGLIVLGIFGLIMDRTTHGYRFDWDVLEYIGFIFGGIILGFCLIILPVLRYDTHIDVKRIEQARDMIENRYDVSEVERATLYGQMIEFNMDIVEYQESNKSPWLNWFVPDEVDSVELLK